MREQKQKFPIIFPIVSTLIVITFSYLINKNLILSSIYGFATLILLVVYSFAKIKLQQSNKIRKMESVFPDFLQLVSSNLKAGITIEKALISSSRKEFAPLDTEINQLGKDIITGRQITRAMKDMSLRINSKKITKTINLLISGIKSGGDVATLLEETSTNLREREFVEKKSASNVLMYLIFIFFATSVGAPVLFALSTVLVDVMTQILSNIPAIDTSFSVPFSLTSISVSSTFILYFSIVFLITTNILGSLVMGLVRKGEEKEGMRYMLPMVCISVVTFLLVRIFLSGYFSNLIG